jgi:hypothetical protein
MSRQRRFQILGLSATVSVVLAATVCALICLLVSWYAYRVYKGIEAWANYDPKKAAITQTKLYTDAAYAHSEKPGPKENPVHPDGEWPHQCWELLRQPAVESSNQYTMTVIYYNWEARDSSGASGADEIIVQVDFANASRVLVNFYGDEVLYCYLPQDWLKYGND